MEAQLEFRALLRGDEEWGIDCGWMDLIGGHMWDNVRVNSGLERTRASHRKFCRSMSGEGVVVPAPAAICIRQVGVVAHGEVNHIVPLYCVGDRALGMYLGDCR